MLSGAWRQVRLELRAGPACMHPPTHRAHGLQQVWYLSAALLGARHAAHSAPARKAAEMPGLLMLGCMADLLYLASEVDAPRRQPATVLAVWGQALCCLQTPAAGSPASLLHPGKFRPCA